MLYYILLLIFLICSIHCRICPADMGAVFLVTEPHSDRNNHCFDYCGRTNCSAVLLNPSGCIALARNDIPPPDSRTVAIHKHCVQHIISTQIVYREMNQALLDHTEKIERAMDEFHCLSLCARQIKFTCRSLMFYKESGDCLMNSANSDTAELTKDSEGFKVTYMERRLPGDAPCVSSFAVLPPIGARLRGEYRKGSATSWEKCIEGCDGCDKVIYGKECLLLAEASEGKIIDISNQLVFDNICKEAPALTCPMEESLFIARNGMPEPVAKRCLIRCLNTKNCQYAYRQEEMCQISPVPIEGKDLIIERICPGLGPLEAGVLFEEKKKCLTGAGLKFTGLNLYQCMALCLSHPTSSCDSISFYDDEEVCELLDSSAITSSNRTLYCQHFSLGIIEERETKNKKRLSGKTGKKHIINQAGTGQKTKTMDKTNIAKRNGENLSVETYCSYSSITVKVKNSSPQFDAHLFLRNRFDNCSSEFEDGHATLTVLLNSSNICGAEKQGNIYKAVVVIKENTSDGMPVITSNDKMYTVRCDYSKHNKKVNITRQLEIRDLPYNSMDVGNRRKMPKLVEMELRSKREEDDSKELEDSRPNDPIVLGHPLELAIKQSIKQFLISSCVAENYDGQENVTIIEDGCPTLTAKDYIVRGSIKRDQKGFVLPLRAFKFRSGNIVRISCVLQHCKKCAKPVCGQRTRRNLLENNGTEEHAVAELLIQEDAGESLNNLGQICMRRSHLIFGIIAWSLLIGIEFSVSFFIIFYSKHIRAYLVSK